MGTTTATVPAPAETGPDAGDDTRAALLAAAAEVFAEKGYEGAGVAEIARRAGLTTGAIYSRYTGKAQLLLEAIEHHAPVEIRELVGGPTVTAAPDEFLARLATHLVDDQRIDSGLLVEVLAAARRDPEVATSLRAVFEHEDTRLAELVRTGQADGLFADDLPVDAVVRFCTALGLGMRVSASVGLHLPDPDDWAVVIERVLAAASPTDPHRTTPPTNEEHHP